MNNLYKYINFPKDKEDEIIESIFIKNQLYYSDPFKFNDPYDCEVTLNANGMGKEDLVTFLTNFILPYSRDLKTSFNSKQLRDLVLNHSNNEKNNLMVYFNKQINDTILFIKRNIRISCFSKNPKSVAMWGYYANGHRGIVLEYDEKLLKNTVNRDSVFETVNYKDSHPKPSDFDFKNNNHVQMDIFLRKSVAWEHEEEVRSILNINYVDKNGLITMQPNTIKSIIFGYRVDPVVLKKIANIVNKDSLDIKFKAIVKDGYNYKLEIEDIKDINEYYFNNYFNNESK